ncbi:hypothetical protein [Helicobacter sp. 23-1045]
MGISKKSWMQIHLYLSLFFLPMCLIYVLTGIGYIFDFKDSAGAKIIEFALPNAPQKGAESSAIIEILRENNLKIPRDTELKTQKNALTMGGLKYSVSLQNSGGEWKVRVMERSVYGVLVLMHKAKGAVYFNALAVCFALSLAIFYLSGIIMTSFCKNKRKSAGIAVGSGLIITIIAVILSAI